MSTPESQLQEDVPTFAKRLRAKAGDAYPDLDDSALVSRFLRKNPVYTDRVRLPEGFKLLTTTTGHSKLDSLYEQAGREHNVDPNLLIEQGRQETVNFNPDVVYGRRNSPKGARGAGQFMPDTAREFGLQVGNGVDERSDPVKSISAHARMMRQLLDRHNGDTKAALAGYNSGHNLSTGAALRNARRIPETRGYVDKIFGTYSKLSDPTIPATPARPSAPPSPQAVAVNRDSSAAPQPPPPLYEPQVKAPTGLEAQTQLAQVHAAPRTFGRQVVRPLRRRTAPAAPRTLSVTSTADTDVQLEPQTQIELSEPKLKPYQQDAGLSAPASLARAAQRITQRESPYDGGVYEPVIAVIPITEGRPSAAEVVDALMEKLGPGWKQLGQKYRAETGREPIEPKYLPEPEQVWNDDLKRWEWQVETSPTKEFIEIMKAYQRGGVVEASRVAQAQRATKGDAFRKQSEEEKNLSYGRQIGRDVVTGLGKTVQGTAQLAENLRKIHLAEDPRIADSNQSAIEEARARMPGYRTNVGALAGTAVETVGDIARMEASPLGPLVEQFAENINRGGWEAAKSAGTIAALRAAGIGADKLAKLARLSPVQRQVFVRAVQGDAFAATAAMQGESGKELLKAFGMGAAFPVGKGERAEPASAAPKIAPTERTARQSHLDMPDMAVPVNEGFTSPRVAQRDLSNDPQEWRRRYSDSQDRLYGEAEGSPPAARLAQLNEEYRAAASARDYARMRRIEDETDALASARPNESPRRETYDEYLLRMEASRASAETPHHSEIQPRDDSGQFRKVTTKDLREAREQTPESIEQRDIGANQNLPQGGQSVLPDSSVEGQTIRRPASSESEVSRTDIQGRDYGRGTSEGAGIAVPRVPAGDVGRGNSETRQADTDGEGTNTSLSGKQPWQLTYHELHRVLDENRPQTYGAESPRASLLRALWPDYINRETPDLGNDFAHGIWLEANEGKAEARLPLSDLSMRHRRVIEQAVSEGKPVPAEVLADYPDLQRPARPQIPEEVNATSENTADGRLSAPNEGAALPSGDERRQVDAHNRGIERTPVPSDVLAEVVRRPAPKLSRNYRAGTNDATLTFTSELQRDLYDAGARLRTQRSGSVYDARRTDADALIDSVAKRLGVDREEAIRLARETHDDVKSQMRGVKHLETRAVVDNVRPQAEPTQTATHERALSDFNSGMRERFRLPEHEARNLTIIADELDRGLAEKYEYGRGELLRGVAGVEGKGEVDESALYQSEDTTQRSPIRWVGGKRQFIPVLRKLFEPFRSRRLVEPFFGSGTVSFGLKPERALVNDYNSVLANFHKRVAEGLEYDLPYKANAEDFAKARDRYNTLLRKGETETPEAAKLFYYLNQTAHGGLYRVNQRGEFNAPFQADRAGKPIRSLSSYGEQYKGIEVRGGDFEKLRVGRNDFIYSDPPYDSQFSSYQKGGFGWGEQVRHAEWLAKQNVPVVTQNEATPRILALYKRHGFDVWEIPARRSISRDTSNRGVGSATEMIAFRNVPAEHIKSSLEGTGARPYGGKGEVLSDYNALRQQNKAATQFLKDGRAIIRALEDPDVSSGLHEFHHVFVPHFAKAILRVKDANLRETGEAFFKWLGFRSAKEFSKLHDGYVNETLTPEAKARYVAGQEKGSRGFERYMKTGEAPNVKLRQVFADFKEWLTNIYGAVRGKSHPLAVKPSPEAIRAWDAVLGEPKGEFGQLIHHLHKAPDEGTPPFFENAQVKRAAGLRPDASTADVRAAITEQVGKPRSSHLSPDDVIRWANSKNLQGAARKALDFGVSKYRETVRKPTTYEQTGIRKRNVDPATQSLSEFVRASGGIRVDRDRANKGELAALTNKEAGTSGLVRADGRTVEQMANAAAEAGYPVGTGGSYTKGRSLTGENAGEDYASADTFLETLSADLGGDKVYSSEREYDYEEMYRKAHPEDNTDALDSLLATDRGATLYDKVSDGTATGREVAEFKQVASEHGVFPEHVSALIRQGKGAKAEGVQGATFGEGRSGRSPRRSGDVEFTPSDYETEGDILFQSANTRPGFREASPEERKTLRIPPAWTDVHVSEEPNARLIAVGRDSKGRTQRIYSAAHTESQLIAKFVRQRDFNAKLPDILDRVDRDIKQGHNVEEASVLRLIAQTGFRVGGEADTGGKVEAYGASTLRPEHVKIDGDTVHFDFAGKLGVRQEHSVTDAQLARDIEARIERGGPQLFRTTDARVRNYLRRIAGDYKVHDFRTWNATEAARKAIEDRESPKTAEGYWRARDEVGDIAARKIGDTRQIALETYVDPLVFEGWRESAGVKANDQRPRQARRKAGDVQAAATANGRPLRDQPLRPRPTPARAEGSPDILYQADHRPGQLGFIGGELTQESYPAPKNATKDQIEYARRYARDEALGKAFGEESFVKLRGLLQDPNVRRVAGEVLKRAPVVQRQGNANVPDVLTALSKLAELKRQKQTVSDYLNQGSLFGERELTPAQERILSRLDANPRKVLDELFPSAPEPTQDMLFQADHTAAQRRQRAYKALLREKQPDLFDEMGRPKQKKPEKPSIILKARRAVILSGIPTLAKLTAAAGWRVVGTPVEEAVGGGLSKVAPKLAGKAPREGRASVRAEANALKAVFSMDTLRDARDKIKTGESSLDRKYGKRDETTDETVGTAWLDFFGRLHGALKVPAQRAEFYRSLEKRGAHAARNGVDITDPAAQLSLGVQAYADSTRAIFMHDNLATNVYKEGLRYLRQKGGDVGKAAATVGQVVFPIVKVPTNYVREAAQYVPGVGAAEGFGKIILRGGIKNLKPEEADAVMRAFKKQTIGLGLVSIGFFNPQAFGGYYTRGERDEKDLEAGEIKLFGVKIPHLLAHSPAIEAIQFGATVRRVLDSQKEAGKDRDAVEATYQAGKGLAEQSPFIDSYLNAGRTFENTKSVARAAGEFAKGLVIPPDVQRAAKYFDKDAEGKPVKRYPQGSRLERFYQSIEAGIPGLRKNVPDSKEGSGRGHPAVSRPTRSRTSTGRSAVARPNNK